MESQELSKVLARISPGASRAAAYAVCLGCFAPFLYHLSRHSNGYLGFFEDDFFYYAVIADKFVTLGRLTFDGTTPTNGFHPLWFAIITGIRFVTGGVGASFFVGVGLVLLACMVTTYEALRALARSLGATPALAPPLAALCTVTASPLIASGMEVALAIPLYTLLLREVARGQALESVARARRLGFLSSLTVLARLDLALAVALMLGAWLTLIRPPRLRAVRVLGAFCAGGILVPAYFVYNRLVFGAFLPTSALAKQIRTNSMFNVRFLRDGIHEYGAIHLACIGLALTLVLSLVWRAPRGETQARTAGTVALAFPLFFALINASLSDWFFFPWYAYPHAPALLAAYVVLWESAKRWLATPGRTAVGGALLGLWVTVVVPGAALSRFIKWGPGWTARDNVVVGMALELTDRMRGRAGTYAMGDKAGVSAFLLQRPVVQLEGLVADRRLLDHIRRQDPLASVVDEYGVDYLIVSPLRSTGLALRKGCYVIEQPNPNEAGMWSAKMFGKICASPVEHFYTWTGPDRWAQGLPLETFVFDLRGDRRHTLAAL